MPSHSSSSTLLNPPIVIQIINLTTHAEENEEPENKPFKDNEDMEEEEEWTHPDEGVSLVIKHLLHTSNISIFKIRCTVNERVCDLIIDDGNYKNRVSKIVVDKLRLKTHKHPSLYHIRWVKDVGETKVTE